MNGFWFGMAVGILLATLLASLAVRRWHRRMRRLEQAARATERLAELGGLTGGLAHEIKNPLSTVGLNIQLISEDLAQFERDARAADPEGDRYEIVGRIRRRFDALVRETDRLREILEDFLRYAGRVKLDRVPVNINNLVDELADFFAPQAQAANVRIRTDLAAQPAELSADPSLLKQALLNLMINAVQAMSEARAPAPGSAPGSGIKPHGGADNLIIRTERSRAAGPDEVHVHVIDTGPGVAPEVAGQVFQPYFSTKRGGTGLGLPTARRIVEEHGGTLTLHSEPGRGSDFTMTLPVQAPQGSTPSPSGRGQG